MTDADDTISKAAQAGLPINCLRRRGREQSAGPVAPGHGQASDPAPSGDDPTEGQPEIETLAWVDGRLMLVKETGRTKGRT